MINRAEQNWRDVHNVTDWSGMNGDNKKETRNQGISDPHSTETTAPSGEVTRGTQDEKIPTTQVARNQERTLVKTHRIDHNIVDSLMTWARYELNPSRSKDTLTRARIVLELNENGIPVCDVYDANGIVQGGVTPVATTRLPFETISLDKI